MFIFLLGLDASQGNGGSEAVAKFDGAKPVKLEVAVEVASSTDFVKGDWAFSCRCTRW